MNGSRFPRLDALRGLACLAIVIEHALQPASVALGMRFTPIFFILSGFLLYLPVANGRARFDVHWFAKRALRLLPAFWLALIVAGWLGTFGDAPTLRELLGAPGSALPQAWSLGVEFAFYVGLPVLVLLGSQTSRPHLVAVGSIAVLGVGTTIALPWGATLAQHATFIAVGMLAAVAHSHGRMPRLPATLLLPPLLATTMLTAQDAFAPFLLGAVLGVLLLSTALHADACLLGRLLDKRMLRGVGSISFGVYLWHMTAIYAFDTVEYDLSLHMPLAIATLAFGLVGGLTLGAVSYHALERPVMRTYAAWIRARASTAAVTGRSDTHLPRPVRSRRPAAPTPC